MHMIMSKLQEIVKVREDSSAAVHGFTESDTTEQLSNWATSELPSFRNHLKKFTSEKQFETTELGYYIIVKLF